MAKLGSDKRPAVVRVRTMPKGEEIVALCEKHHWKVIVSIEPDQPEDLSDIDLLLRGQIGRASCRERGEISVVAGSLKKKKRQMPYRSRSGSDRLPEPLPREPSQSPP